MTAQQPIVRVCLVAPSLEWKPSHWSVQDGCAVVLNLSFAFKINTNYGNKLLKAGFFEFRMLVRGPGTELGCAPGFICPLTRTTALTLVGYEIDLNDLEGKVQGQFG